MSRQRSWAFCLVAMVTAGLAGFASSSATAQTATPAPVLKPVIVILTSGISDPPRCVMALSLAESALGTGRKVVVYLDVDAPELARKNRSDNAFVAGRRTPGAKGMETAASLQKTLNALMAKGAKVSVCPMCMKTLKLTQESLLDGVTVLTDSELLEMTGDATVISY